MILNKKNIIVLAVVGLVIGVGFFYGGVMYGKKHVSNFGSRNVMFNQTANMMNRGTRMTGGITTGEIISKDDKTLTLKLVDGGSKIIFLGSATKISKTTDGTAADLAAGTEVTISGTANADGSLNAESVQIRPNTAQPVLKY